MSRLMSAFLVVAVTGVGFCDSPDDVATDYVLVITGGELLRGVYADGHTLFLTRTLGPLGCRCIGTYCVGDLGPDLTGVLEHAVKRAKLIIVTGGLGPTDDDITRETLSKFTGIPLVENAELVQAMMRRFDVQSRDALRKNLLRQTLVPQSGTYLANSNGTAAGLVFECSEQVIVALPGPPRELQPMVKDHLVPYLGTRFGIHSLGSLLTMRFVGIGESQIDQVIHERLNWPKELVICSLFEFGRVDLTISLSGDTPADHARLKEFEAGLLGQIGEYMYSDDGSSLETCVLSRIAKRKSTLVTAEVGSGGGIAAALNGEEKAPKVYAGGYVAPSDSALLGMLDLPSEASNSDGSHVRVVAEHLCKRTGSGWSLVVGEIMEREDGSRSVWVVYGGVKEGFDVECLSLRGHGEIAQAFLVNQPLDLLRRKLKEATH